jgi:hypothetical protein
LKKGKSVFDRTIVFFTIAATFHLMVLLPSMVLLALGYLCTGGYREKGRNLLKFAMLLAAGFLAGVFLAWLIAIVPSGWELPVWETVYAGFHSDVYGHEVEHAAEQYALFMFFVGDVCAIVTISAVWVLGKRRFRKYNPT